MNQELSSFAARLRELISAGDDVRSFHSIATGGFNNEPPHVGSYFENFNELALELFALQFKHNSAYRKICEARKLTPQVVEHWTQIPAVPTAAFKELELTSLAPDERTAVFHSSGTTEQKPSRHFHNAESLAVYEASLLVVVCLKTFLARFTIYDLRFTIGLSSRRRRSKRRIRRSSTCLKPCGKNSAQQNRHLSASWQARTAHGLWISMQRLRH